MEEEKMIDQSELANSVAEKIPYEFLDMFLVKPLDPIKVMKEFSKPVAKDQAKVDENGINAVDFDEVETEVKEVDSDYRKGIVLKLPMSYITQLAENKEKYCLTPIKVGNIVIFRERSGQFFDLVKDSKMIRYYDIVAIEQ